MLEGCDRDHEDRSIKLSSQKQPADFRLLNPGCPPFVRLISMRVRDDLPHLAWPD